MTLIGDHSFFYANLIVQDCPQVSISPMFNEQLLRAQVLKAQKHWFLNFPDLPTYKFVLSMLVK